MDFLSVDSSSTQRKDSRKGTVPQSVERRQKREATIRKEKRDLTLKRRRVGDETSLGSHTKGAAAAPYALDETLIQESVRSLGEVGSEKCLKGLRVLRGALCGLDPPIQAVIDRGGVPALIQLLRVPNAAVQSDAVWCLTNIATGTHDQTGAVLDAVPDLLAIIGGEDRSLGEQACWTMGNIAGDGDEYRSRIISNGAVTPLLRFVIACVGSADWYNNSSGEGDEVSRHTHDVVQAQTAAWALSNLARGQSTPASAFMQAGTDMVPALISLVQYPDHRLAMEIWWVFTFLTAKEDLAVQHLVDAGLVSSIAAAMAPTRTYPHTHGVDPGDIACIPLIRCLGNLSSGPEHWIDSIVAEPAILACLLACVDQDSQNSSSGNSRGGIPALDPNPPHRAVLKESIWVLSNLLGGTQLQQSTVLNSGPVLHRLFSAFYSDYFEVQREAVFAIHHACQSAEVLMMLIQSTFSNNRQSSSGNHNPNSNSHFNLEDLLLQLAQFVRVPDEEVLAASLEVVSAFIIHLHHPFFILFYLPPHTHPSH
jgi:hypothetical protein